MAEKGNMRGAIADIGKERVKTFIKDGFDHTTAKKMALKEAEAIYRIQNEVNKSTNISGGTLTVILRKENVGIDETSLREIVNTIVG